MLFKAVSGRRQKKVTAKQEEKCLKAAGIKETKAKKSEKPSSSDFSLSSLGNDAIALTSKVKEGVTP